MAQSDLLDGGRVMDAGVGAKGQALFIVHFFWVSLDKSTLGI